MFFSFFSVKFSFVFHSVSVSFHTFNFYLHSRLFPGSSSFVFFPTLVFVFLFLFSNYFCCCFFLDSEYYLPLSPPPTPPPTSPPTPPHTLPLFLIPSFYHPRSSSIPSTPLPSPPLLLHPLHSSFHSLPPAAPPPSSFTGFLLHFSNNISCFCFGFAFNFTFVVIFF